jgi:plastocyanin
MRRHRCCALLIVAAALACGGGGGEPYGTPTNPNPPGSPSTPGTPANANEVSVRDNSYSPASATVKAGTTVTWTWAAGNYSSHTVTFADGPASPDQTSGTYARTFSSAGTFNYQCAVHGSSMSGSVVVQP